MVEILHFLSALFGVAGIIFAVFADVNLVTACTYPKDMTDEAWPYAKKAYIFLGLMLISLALCIVLGVCF